MFKEVTLEVSLKPFYNTYDASVEQVVEKIYEQWKPLIKEREIIRIMLWIGDGSEILDYDGKESTSFDWAHYLGMANCPDVGDLPKHTSLHTHRQLYRENIPNMTYGILKNITNKLKKIGNKRFPNSKILLNATFDIGPEFAESDFKYKRHKEICLGATESIPFGLVDATAILNGDDRKYASYPNGIPDKLPFGTFFGKQANAFLSDLGFDCLWLSNGLGFGLNPWGMTGKIFDGKNFHPERVENTSKQIFKFWKLFRAECKLPLMVRGSNNSVGIDYATEGVPLYDIYNANLDITPPPNSPWSALNDNYGLEMMGHMTRVCELPNEDRGFLFRFYIHDLFWVNSPWYDRYNGYPMDIYLPMAIIRIDKKGKVNGASMLNVFTLDNSFGEMPDSCVYEPLPHLLKAEKDLPDEPAPIVWVYPMKEYTTSKDLLHLQRMYYGDRFIQDSINNGFPLCCVTSTQSFLEHSYDLYKKSIILSPTPETAEIHNKLKQWSENGAKIIIYGLEEDRNLVDDIICKFVAISDDSEVLRNTLAEFDYAINFDRKIMYGEIGEQRRNTVLAISRCDNAFMFSVYNRNTTNGTSLKFPLGAPILIGGETEIIDGYSKYHFARSEHRECRVMVQQDEGTISCKEGAPVNAGFRRRIWLRGLKNATVCVFGEEYCKENLAFGTGNDYVPDFKPQFKLVHDEENGTYYKGENISGEISIYMPSGK